MITQIDNLSNYGYISNNYSVILSQKTSSTFSTPNGSKELLLSVDYFDWVIS